MKTNCWLILGTMLATTAVAQVNTNKLPAIPAPAVPAAAAMPAPAPTMAPTDAKTNAPAKKAVKAKKKAVKKKAVAKASEKKAAEKSADKESVLSNAPVTLVPGPATVAGEKVNLRGQAGLQGEVVGQVKKGDAVTVLAEITLDKPKAGEPAQWAKIALPGGAKVWLNAKYVDATNKVVLAKKLNLRGGPGENYSVLGVIEKGASVTPVTTKGDWMEIETPSSAFAFVAAGFLKQEGGVSPESNVPNQPVVAAAQPMPAPMPVMPPTPTTVAEAPTIAPPAANPPVTPEVTAPAPVPAPPMATPNLPPTLLPPPSLATDDTDTNLPPRIVIHEGTVRHAVSLVAPTYYELYDPANNKAINYLYTTSTNLNLARYNGKHITVKGEEGLDVRWRDTPVLTIEQITVLPPEPMPKKPVSHPSK